MKKKGQLQGLSFSIMALITAVIFLVVGLVIIQEIRDTDTVSASQSGSASNETLTTVTETGETLARTECLVACSPITVTNASSGTVIPSTNFSTSNSGCTLAFTSGNSLGVNNSNWNVTYSYTYGDSACTTANSSLVAVGDFSDFIPIIVIALA